MKVSNFYVKVQWWESSEVTSRTIPGMLHYKGVFWMYQLSMDNCNA